MVLGTVLIHFWDMVLIWFQNMVTVFLWFSYGFGYGFLMFTKWCYGFGMVLLWFCHGFLTVSVSEPHG